MYAAAIITTFDFYPRPPGGGRLFSFHSLPHVAVFLSTPSGWRATSVNDEDLPF